MLEQNIKSGAALKIKSWRLDPVLFTHDNFEIVLDIWQKKAIVAFADRDNKKFRRIVMQACAGPGKSCLLAMCGWYFLTCFAEKGEHPKGYAVSVTQDTLRDTLWVELAKLRNRSEFLQATFEFTQTRIFAKDHPETWFIAAKSFPKSADPETIGKTLSGLHGKYLLYLIDESGDIPPEIAKAAEQGIGESMQRPGHFAKILTAGNPISTSGLLYSASESSNWHTIRITSDPDDPERTPRVSKEWAEEQIKKYGREDAWVMAYILGRFPKTAVNSLLSLDEVEDAMGRTIQEKDYLYMQKRLGIDVAREGMDSTVIFPRQGLMAFQYVEMKNADGPTVAARVAQAKARWGSEIEAVDNTGGFGGSVLDSLKMAGFTPIPVHFSGKPLDSRYFNKRSEMHFMLAEWVKRGGCLPRCESLKKELTTPVYTFHNGRFRLEEKDQIKRRLGFSPDKADALALTFCLAEQPAMSEFDYLNRSNKIEADYDPFARD